MGLAKGHPIRQRRNNFLHRRTLWHIRHPTKLPAPDFLKNVAARTNRFVRSLQPGWNCVQQRSLATHFDLPYSGEPFSYNLHQTPRVAGLGNAGGVRED